MRGVSLEAGEASPVRQGCMQLLAATGTFLLEAGCSSGRLPSTLGGVAFNPRDVKINLRRVVFNPRDVKINLRRVIFNPRDVKINPLRVIFNPRDVKINPRVVTIDPRAVKGPPSEDSLFVHESKTSVRKLLLMAVKQGYSSRRSPLQAT